MHLNNVRAVLRAKIAPSPFIWCKLQKVTFSQSSSLSLRARAIARSYDAHHKIILTKKILFIYLIGNVDQKVTKIAFIENYEKIEKSKKF